MSVVDLLELHDSLHFSALTISLLLVGRFGDWGWCISPAFPRDIVSKIVGVNFYLLKGPWGMLKDRLMCVLTNIHPVIYAERVYSSLKQCEVSPLAFVSNSGYLLNYMQNSGIFHLYFKVTQKNKILCTEIYPWVLHKHLVIIGMSGWSFCLDFSQVVCTWYGFP